MTLRLRLVLALVGLVAAGLLIAGAVTYSSLRSFLLDRVDEQLLQARLPVSRELGFGSPPPGGGASLPPGTYGQLRTLGGVVLNSVAYSYGDETPPAPALPVTLPEPAAGRQVAEFTTGAAGGAATRFRVLAQPFDHLDRVLVVAIPLTDVRQTLARLVAVEVIVTVAVLAGLGAFAWWLVRRELRPLDEMASAAGRIAAGDLSERVQPAEPRTEVGRLGLALNAMLEQIERAFAERAATEDKLRRFLADASHELRTPLTSIRGYAEVFRRGAKDDPQDLTTAMRRIEEEGGRMGLMVEELLLLARLGEEREPAYEPVDLVRLAADAVSDARAADPERAIDLDAPQRLVVLGDEPQLRQVAGNLVGNALRHTPPDTPVRVTAHEEDQGAVLAVADEGPGMTAETAARVFEPFYRADKSRARQTGGAGLGLAIVAAVAEAHGGRVELTTAPGQGATFTVHLPRQAARTPDA